MSVLSNFHLNDLLIDLGRSLVQYVGASWPWTPVEEEEEQRVIGRIVASQRASAARITDLLFSRGHYIDYGTYPTEYTSLHYVALDYLLNQLISDQQQIVDECDSLLREAHDDPEAAALLAEVAEGERRHFQELRSLAARRKSAQPA